MASSESAMPSSLRIGLIQTRPIPLEPEQNFTIATKYIRSAASQGATLAVLPEYHLTGWAPDDSRFREIAAGAATYLQRYQQLAKECSIHIVPGTIVTRAANGALLNKTHFISNTGDILGEYTKTNLWHPERSHLTSGPDFAGSCMGQNAAPASPHTVIHTPIGPIGLLICYDLCFPEAFRSLIRAGAKVVIIPTYTKSDDMSPAARSYNSSGEELFVRSALISRAFENTCCVVFCNVGGSKEENFMGLSQVVLPIMGSLPGAFEDSSEGLKAVDVDLSVLDAAENNYKVRRDLARADFHYR